MSERKTGATIDAIEGGVAQLEADSGVTFTLPAKLLPPGAGEGDRITLTLAAAPAETKAARARLAKKRGRLAADDDGGDIEL